MSQRRGRIPGLKEDDPEIVLRVRVVGFFANGGFVTTLRFGDFTLLVVDAAEVVVRLGVVGLQSQRSGILVDRFRYAVSRF